MHIVVIAGLYFIHLL